MKRVLIILSCVLMASSTFGATMGRGPIDDSGNGIGPTDGPPAFSRQVAVYAQPSQLPGLEVVKYLPHAGISVVKVTEGQELATIRKFENRGLVAGRNLVASKFATVNDPFYSPYQWHMSHIQSDQAWNITNGAGVTVAVLDTGLARSGAEDGVGCYSPNSYDVVNGDNDPDDGDGHGTHVSGTIAQTTNNSTGTVGLAYGACIMAVKVLDDSGSGSFADIADGIFYAVDNGASVINMSLGINARYGVTNDPLVDPALDYAYANNVTVVVAAGNDGNRKNVSYPAIYPTVIAVGATGYDNGLVRYSNRGTGLDVVAPGGDTGVDLNGDGYVDGVLQETRLDGAWGYYFFQGTSMASPHVAAAAALLYANGTNTPDDVMSALTSTAMDLGSGGYDKTFGWGLIQVADALSGGGTGCTDADGDGYCVSEGDCDDGNAAVNPGMSEVCGDNIDNNCDGQIDEGCDPSCTDADGDGWCVEQGDCDDSDPQVNPGMNERGKRRKDGKDNDCNGVIDG